MDANGDGVGDFQGLMRRLDYLHGLGITAIWLMPFQTSPGSRRWLRRLRLLRGESRLRDLGRLRRVHARRQAARNSRHHRPGGESHIRSTPVVSGGAPRSQVAGTATGTSGPTRSRPMRTRAWCFPACRSRPGPTTRKRAPGISTASTTSSRTSTPRTPTFRPRSSRSWGSGSSSASPGSGWTRCRS